MDVYDPSSVSVHMMVGMGETEKEMMEAIQRLHNMGSAATLFSFYPEGKSRMADHPIPSMGRYRRIQLGRYLVNRGLTDVERISFNEEGRIKEYGVTPEVLEEAIRSGVPFETTGCPDREGKVACNRPFANSLPGPDVRNYPFAPNAEEIERIRSQIWT
jgi:biotin synthase